MADNYPLLLFCNECITKYSCITCDSPVCNICSKDVSPDTTGYNDELKKVGQCKSCSVQESAEKDGKPPKKIQKTIFNMFGSTSSKSATLTKENPKQADKISSSKMTSRTVTPSTIEKWKSELAEYFVPEWLEHAVDSKGKVKYLRCKFCTTQALK